MRNAFLIVVVTSVVLSAGCVQREMVISTDPPGAIVLVDGTERGTTPARVEFDYYGTHEIELRHPGYRTLTSVKKVSPPWYEVFPLDVFSELLLPVKLVDRHEFSYRLTRYTGTEPDKLLRRAKDLSEGLAQSVPVDATQD